MNPIINEYLSNLYGEDRAGELSQRLRIMLERFRESPAAPVSTEPSEISQRDAILITYADQLRRTGEPSLKTLAAFCERHLTDTISGLHILPFYPWSSDDGFSVKDYYEVDPAYGAWRDIGRLRPGFDLMFDAVFNHASAQGAWFQRFLAGDARYRDFFVTVRGNPDLSQVVRPRALPLLTEFASAEGPKQVWTTFSADQVDLNFANPEVLAAMVEVLLFYVRQGARFIRLDAIAFLWKTIGTSCLHLPQTHTVIRLLRAVLDEVAPRVQLITETNVPHAENLSYFGGGAGEAQLVYNFALPPLVLHSLQTGNAEKLSAWAESLTLPSSQVTFFNFLASHDGIGLNPVRGILNLEEIDALVRRTEGRGGFISYKTMPDGSRLPYEMNINYLDALSDPLALEPAELAARKFLVAHAILLSLRGMPGLYFHSLFGSRGDRPGAVASGIPRRINREKLGVEQLEQELGDSGSLRARVWHGLGNLLGVRRAAAEFHPRSAQSILSLDPRVFAVRRAHWKTGREMLCLHNVSEQAVALSALFPSATRSGAWRDKLAGRRVEMGKAHGGAGELRAYETLWLCPEGN